MAAVDYFLKIDGIDGESKAQNAEKWIQLQSWSWGETNAGSMAVGGGGGSGKVAMQDFHFVMPVSTATPKLILACATGQHINKAILACRKAGGTQGEYLTYTFEDIMIASYQTSGSDSPTDQCSLNFTKIKVEYREQSAKGTLGGPITANYNLKTQRSE